MQGSRLILFAFLTLLLAACSSGGFSPPPGNRCTAGANPVNMNLPADKRLSLKQKDNAAAAAAKKPAMLPGTYTYSSSDMLYRQSRDSNVEGFLIWAHDAPSSDGKVSKTSVACLRNATPQMSGYKGEGVAVTDIIVSSDFTMKATSRHMAINVYGKNGDSVIEIPLPDIVDQKLDSPDLAYGKALDSYMLWNGTTYQINSNYLAANGAEFLLTVHLLYKPFGVTNPEPPK